MWLLAQFHNLVDHEFFSVLTTQMQCAVLQISASEMTKYNNTRSLANVVRTGRNCYLQKQGYSSVMVYFSPALGV